MSEHRLVTCVIKQEVREKLLDQLIALENMKLQSSSVERNSKFVELQKEYTKILNKGVKLEKERTFLHEENQKDRYFMGKFEEQRKDSTLPEADDFMDKINKLKKEIFDNPENQQKGGNSNTKKSREIPKRSESEEKRRQAAISQRLT